MRTSYQFVSFRDDAADVCEVDSGRLFPLFPPKKKKKEKRKKKQKKRKFQKKKKKKNPAYTFFLVS